MKKCISFLILILFLGYNNAQVGINSTTPNASAIMDVSSTNKGLYIPKYNMTTLTSNTSPVNDPANGLMIYNTGTTFAEGIYYWIGNQYVKLNTVGEFDEVLSLNIPGSTTKLVVTTTASTNSESTVSGYATSSNNISGPVPATVATDGTITLPKGKYKVYVKLDGTVNNTTLGTGYYSFTNAGGSQINFHNFGVSALLTDGTEATNLTEVQTASNLSSGTIVGYEYNFWLNLAQNSNTVKLKLFYNTNTSTSITAANAINNPVKVSQSGLKITIIRML